MRFDSKKYGVMVWRRIIYFMKAMHCSFGFMAENTGYTYRGICASNQVRSEPAVSKLIAMADIFGISLEELCDPRIPVTDVKHGKPYRISEWEEKRYKEEVVDYYRRLCLEDTRRIYKGAGVKPPDSLVKALDEYFIQKK